MSTTKTYIQFLDDDGTILEEMLYEKEEWCYGSRTGCTGEMCGGCSACLALQALHSGTKTNYIEREE